VLSRAADADEPLAALETAGQAGFAGGTGAAYTLGWLRCERLSMTRGEDAVAHGFWLTMAKHRDSKKAFADAFGTTPADFYRDFEAYRATL
jgi:alpha-D-ribose 1-methylphosphonate 5-triphosphate synthase subunit PhnG